MSIDFQLAFPCPHYTSEEVVLLGDDRRTLSLKQTLGSAASVRILANNKTVLLPQGVYSQAIVEAPSGPYLVRETETLTVTTSQGSGTLSLTRGSYTTAQLVSRMVWGGVEVDDLGGRVGFSDPSNASTAYVQVEGGGFLGLASKQRIKSRLIYPPWSVVRKESVDPYPQREVIFHSPLRQNPVLKVSYSAPLQRCLRCSAAVNENDVRFNAQGDLLTVKDEDLLYQASLKILLTDKGSNPFHPTYGTLLRKRIGQKAQSNVAMLIKEDVRRALINMQNYQTQQSKYQRVSLKETLYSILSLNVKRHVQNVSAYQVFLTVQNASGERVDLNIFFTVPEVVSLMGRDGLILNTQRSGVS